MARVNASLRSIGFACFLGAQIAAQVVVSVEEDRKASRLVFVAGFEQPAEVAVQYGAVTWREEYAQAETGKAAAHFRLGDGYWASLHNNVELNFGGKKAPSSVWYLGLYRDAANKWHLSLMGASKLHRTGQTSGSTRDVRHDLLVPLRVTKQKVIAEQLSIRLVSPDPVTKPGASQLVMRWGPFEAVADFGVEAVVSKPAGEPTFAALDPARVVETPSGLRYQELRPGAGKQPGADSTVTVNYVGWNSYGTKFDSSFARKQSVSFPLNAVIKGWQEGITRMQPGAVFLLEIPPELAYGDAGAGGVIQPNATLVFLVELLKF